MQARFKKAVLYCALLFMAAFVFGTIVGSAGCSNTPFQNASSAPESSYASSIWESLKNNKSFEESITQAGLQAPDLSNTPNWFSEEVISLSSSTKIYANREFSIVSISFENPSENLISDFLTTLENKGWRQFETGNFENYTLTKEGGECRWLMISGSQRDGGLDLLMHIKRN